MKTLKQALLISLVSLVAGVSLFAVSLASSLLIYLLGGMMTHTYLYHEIIWMLLALPICLENATRKLVDSAEKRI